METLLAAGVALYAWLNRQTSTSTTDPGSSSGGGLGVVVPSGPVVAQPTAPVFTPGDANAIAGELGKAGKVAADAATGLAVGLGVGTVVQNEVFGTRKEVAPYTNDAIPWAFGAAGAGIGVAVGLGVLTVSVSTVAFVAFPIAVAVLAVIDVAGNIEMNIRREKERVRYREISELVSQRQFRRAWDLAVSSVVNDEMPWMMPKSVKASPGFITEEELGDSPTVLIEATKAPPSSSALSGGAELGTVSVINGNTVRVTDALRAAYKPVVDAFNADKPRLWSSWQKSIKAQQAWMEAHRAELDAGNAIADALIAAQPWWDTYAFRWRPAFPPAADGSDGVIIPGQRRVTPIVRAQAQADAGAGKTETATTGADADDADTAARSGSYGPRRLAGGGDV